MYLKVKDYEFEWRGIPLLINALVYAEMEDLGLGEYEYWGSREVQTHRDVDEIVVTDWECYAYDDDSDSYEHTYLGPDAHFLKESFINSIYSLILESVMEDEVIDYEMAILESC